jgi:hypothetical protein
MLSRINALEEAIVSKPQPASDASQSTGQDVDSRSDDDLAEEKPTLGVKHRKADRNLLQVRKTCYQSSHELTIV